MNELQKNSLEYWDKKHINYEREKIKIDDWLDIFSDKIGSCTTPVVDLGCGGVMTPII